MRVADRCVQVMGGQRLDRNNRQAGFSRAYRILFNGPIEVPKWSFAKKIKRDWKAEQH
jgi:acyl-CoA dehydrogenase